MVTVQQSELKSGLSNMKFTALDHRMKSIRVNDTVKVTEGPFEVWHLFMSHDHLIKMWFVFKITQGVCLEALLLGTRGYSPMILVL